MDFENMHKNKTINYENQLLLNKLVDISVGKWTSVTMAPKRISEVSRKDKVMARNISLISLGGSGANSKLSLTCKGGAGQGPKSLNIINRKKETDRIERENTQIARKLFNNSSHIKK